MAFTIPIGITLLLKHDRELVKFYPYAGNDTDFIQCWLIVKPYNFNNQKPSQLVNIKLFSRFLLDPVAYDLKNINKMVFINLEIFDFSLASVIPILNQPFVNSIRKTEVKSKRIDIVNNYQYANFDFNIIGGLDVDHNPISFLGFWAIQNLNPAVIPPENPLWAIEEIKVPGEPPTDSLVHYLLEDDTNNTVVVDFKAFLNAILNVNSDTISATDFDGNLNSAFLFSGLEYYYFIVGAVISKTYYLEFSVADISSQYTLMFYGNSGGGTGGTSDSVQVVNDTITIHAYDGSPKFASGGTLVANTRYKLAVRFINNGNCEAWMGGVKIISLAVNTRWTSGDRHWVAKASTDLGSSNLSGKIADNQFFNRALNDVEMTDITT